MKDFILGDMLKVITEGLGDNVPVGSVLTCVNYSPIPGFYLSNDEVNVDWANNHKYHFEFVGNIKDQTSAWLKENKWFIRTGSPEKSKLVQEWLFEHECEWLCGKNVQSEFKDTMLTNTDCAGNKEKYMMFSTNLEKKNAQEIKIEFETVVKSVQLPEAPKPTEQQLKIEQLQATIDKAQKELKELKELK